MPADQGTTGRDVKIAMIQIIVVQLSIRGSRPALPLFRLT